MQTLIRCHIMWHLIRSALFAYDPFMGFQVRMGLIAIFSSPGRSPGRAIVLPPASALALASALAAESVLAKC